MVNKEAIFAKTCVDGSDHFDYDQKGQLISIENACETFVNNQNFFLMKGGEKHEYDENGLLIRRITVGRDLPKEYADVEMGYVYNYKMFETKK